MTNATVTQLLSRAQQGDVCAEHEVMPLIYARLKDIAGALMQAERQGHTLRATALVSELVLKKFRRIKTPLFSREHFFSIAANAMKQLLIEHARRRSAIRRLAPQHVADLLTFVDQSAPSTEDRLAVRQVFQSLSKIDSAAAESIHYRFVEGLTLQQTAARVGRPAWRVRNDCDFALDWMARRLSAAR
jgi:RNA polymerase sigma factor (TIGR02999 family)